jgi:hypothetical protein
MKTYYYEVNKCATGIFEAKNKREAKRYCRHLAELFFPTRGIEILKLTRIKKKGPLYTEA